jgi:hypothetical protein
VLLGAEWSRLAVSGAVPKLWLMSVDSEVQSCEAALMDGDPVVAVRDDANRVETCIAWGDCVSCPFCCGVAAGGVTCVVVWCEVVVYGGVGCVAVVVLWCWAVRC